MSDVAYWHRKTVDELFQARHDLHKVRTEFDRVSDALNEAVAEANRWQDAYEHALDTPGPDTLRGWQHRIDQAENRAQAAEQALADWQSGVGCCCGDSHDAEQRAEDAEQRVREHSEEIDQLVARVVAAEQRAERVEATNRGLKKRLAGWKDRAQRVEATNRAAMRDSIDAEARADRAERRADIAEADATDYLDRATRAEEDRDRIEAQARGWKAEVEKVDCRDCNDVELDRYATEQRAESWWHAAKNLCRRQKYWHGVADRIFDALMHDRRCAERAERDAATLQQLLDHLHTTAGTEGRL